jgi:iron complex transport system permease protein
MSSVVKQKITFRIILLLLIVFTILSFFLTPLIGSTSLNFFELFQSSTEKSILFDIRFPRIIFTFLVGFSLALVGAVFQALLRNDLATPYTLGVSSGGALGAVIAIKSGLSMSILGFSNTVIFSMLGSVLTISIIYFIAKTRSGISPVTLILTGVTISLLFSSFILFIHYLADFTETYLMIRWLMGGLQITGWHYSLILLPFCILALVYFYSQAGALNIITAGHEMALSKGVDVFRLQKYAFFGSSILIGIVVSFAGPIGFIGLIVPHVMRLVAGPDHKKLLISAPLFGGAFLMWCDTLARTIIAPAELPVGVITAMLGGPFFIWLLIKRKVKH